jgi:cobalamin biosynthesis Co2+ chelatase CbiK
MGNSEKESLANQAGYEVIVRHLLIIIGGSEYEKLFSYYFYFHHVDRNFQEVAFGEKDEFLIADENLFQIFESEIK